MNVFIIGASGYIGRAVTTPVLRDGHRVTALVRSEASAARLPTGHVRVVAGSVEDLEAVENGLETADAAIYLAIQGIHGASDGDRESSGEGLGQEIALAERVDLGQRFRLLRIGLWPVSEGIAKRGRRPRTAKQAPRVGYGHFLRIGLSR